MSSAERSLDDLFPWMRLWSAAAPGAPQTLVQPILPNWSLISVNETNSSAPETERKILAQDSYGRQIGRLMDAAVALIEERGAGAPERPEFADLIEIKARIDQVKRESAAERIERFRNDLALLKADDPDEYARQVLALRALIGD